MDERFSSTSREAVFKFANIEEVDIGGLDNGVQERSKGKGRVRSRRTLRSGCKDRW